MVVTATSSYMNLSGADGRASRSAVHGWLDWLLLHSIQIDNHSNSGTSIPLSTILARCKYALAGCTSGIVVLGKARMAHG